MESQELKVGSSCDRCPEKAKVFLGYGPHRFCAKHFTNFFGKRVRKTIRLNNLIKYGEKIAVGVSGGKDSMVTLHLLNKFFRETGQNKIEAIMIDEGIKGYRDNALRIGVNYCEARGIPYHIIRFEEELGLDMQGVMAKIHADAKLGSTCSFCGVFRRHFLNSKALEIGADKIATGHNLDDEVQSIAMSFFGNDLSRAAKLGPIAGIKRFDKFVPRIKPLYETPEKEVIAFAAFEGLEHYSEECCPYSWMAKRNHYRKMLNELEEEIPGTKHSILASFRNLKPLLIAKEMDKSSQIMECEVCGSLSNGKVCGFCSQLERLRKTETPRLMAKASAGLMKAGAEKSGAEKPRGIKKQAAMSCVETKSMGSATLKLE